MNGFYSLVPEEADILSYFCVNCRYVIHTFTDTIKVSGSVETMQPVSSMTQNISPTKGWRTGQSKFSLRIRSTISVPSFTL